MSIRILTEFGQVKVRQHLNSKKSPVQTGGGTVKAHRMEVDGTAYDATVNFDYLGNPVPRGVSFAKDVDAFDITSLIPAYGGGYAHRYAQGAERAKVLAILAQAYAEATYSDHFVIRSASHKDIRKLQKLLKKRSDLNWKLEVVLSSLHESGAVSPAFNVNDLPSNYHFEGPPPHLYKYRDVHALAKHLGNFPMDAEQLERLAALKAQGNKAAMLDLHEIHEDVCPLLMDEVVTYN